MMPKAEDFLEIKPKASDFLGDSKPARTMSEEEKGILKGIAETQETGKAIGRGGIKGIFGGVGAAEKGLLQEIPEMLGFKPLEKSTVFPTPEEIGKTLKLKETPEKYKGFEKGTQFLGEFLSPGMYGKGIGAGMRALGRGAEAVTSTAKAMRPAKAIEEIAVPTSASDIGEKIESSVVGKLKDLVKTRKATAEKLFDNYLTAGAKYEDAILSNYQSELVDFYAKNASKLSPQETNLLKNTLVRLGSRPARLGETEEFVRPGIEALEKERRLLNDIAQGLKMEGYEGIPASFAKNLADKLEKSIKTYVPKEFDVAMTEYKNLSEPINRFNAALGQKVVQRADEFLPEISKIDPAKLPNEFFKSRRSLNELRALSGDEKFVQDIARQHVATELRGIKNSGDVLGFIQKNYDWLQELPELTGELNNLANNLKNAERVKTIGGYGGAALIGAEAARGFRDLR